jgi:predicted GNAT superfamily acetyltransferase
VTIEVPMDIASMQTSDVARAAEWRATTRAAFEDRFAAGYRIAGFTVDAARQRAFYLLSKG